MCAVLASMALILSAYASMLPRPVLLTPGRCRTVDSSVGNQLTEVLVQMAGLTDPETSECDRLSEYLNIFLETPSPC